MMNKKKFLKCELQIILFAKRDIILTSDFDVNKDAPEGDEDNFNQ